MNNEEQQHYSGGVSYNMFPVEEKKEDIVDVRNVVFTILIGSSFILMVFTFFVQTSLPAKVAKNSEQTATVTQSETKKAPVSKDAFKDVSLVAQAGFVLDVKDNVVLYAKNEATPLPLASITKIMTALTANTLVGDSAVITIPKESLAQEGDTGLKVGERWSTKNLLDLMLVSSSNDGADAVASVLGSISYGEDRTVSKKRFVEKMNSIASRLDLQTLHFENESGLDVNSTRAGAYGSARDTARLMAYILLNIPSILESTRNDTISVMSLDEVTHTVRNTNLSSTKIPGLLASKTGFSDLAGGNLVVAFDADFNRPVVAVVLGSTYIDRFFDIEQLVSATRKSIR